ncbi:uncharacterized protein LOC141907797 [Tubulanus polymorphus]|uniref:uncharacterized protein LOC141907797 n=1 Tax=Tubulanus polymorphus TaxID=672921 RepID=UPI003DA4FA43
MKLFSADENQIEVLGTIRVSLGLFEETINWDVLIADISDDAILGMDFLTAYDCQIYPGRKTVICQGRQLSEKSDDKRKMNLTKVRSLKKVVIPAMSEVIIPSYINSIPPDGKWAILETSNSWKLGNDLCVAKELVDLNNKSYAVRAMNLSDKPRIVHSGTPLAVLNEVKAVYHSKQNENTTKSKEDLPEFLEDLYKRSCLELDESESLEVKRLLTEYSDIFARTNLDLGEARGVSHHIEVGEAPPIKQRFRRLPIATQTEVNKLIDDMLEAKVIGKSWCSSIVVVRKSDNTISDYVLITDKLMKLPKQTVTHFLGPTILFGRYRALNISAQWTWLRATGK